MGRVISVSICCGPTFGYVTETVTTGCVKFGSSAIGSRGKAKMPKTTIARAIIETATRR